jgi:hypothetical protein
MAAVQQKVADVVQQYRPAKVYPTLMLKDIIANKDSNSKARSGQTEAARMSRRSTLTMLANSLWLLPMMSK